MLGRNSPTLGKSNVSFEKYMIHIQHYASTFGYYCRTASGGWVGRPMGGWIYSIQSSTEWSTPEVVHVMVIYPFAPYELGGGWGCEVSCGGHHRPRGKTTTGSALDGAVFDIAQILAYLVHNMSRSQLYLEFGHFG